LNIFTTTGRAIGDPQTGHTLAGKTKCMFVIEADAEANDLPLRFSCVTFGGVAERAAEIVDGNHLLVSGKLVGNAHTKSMNMIVNNIEVLGEN